MENPNTPTPSGMTPGAASAGSGYPPARRFLVQFKMTACEEYSAPTPAAALSDAENSDAPPLGDFTSDEGPEIVAEWDPVAEYWGDVRPPRPWNGIDENTRDPLELDDDAPAQPSELDDAATDWEAVGDMGRRLYALSVPGAAVDRDELAEIAAALVRMSNEETKGGRK